MPTTIGLASLGCSKNLVDSEVMLGLLTQAGYEVTHDYRDADVIIVNTCAFIGPAKEESINTILELAKFKEDGRCAALVVTGCLAQRYSKDLVAELPEVDAVIGVDQYPHIVSVLERLPGRPGAALRAVERRPLPTDYSFPRVVTTPPHSVYLKIAEGCDRRCTFCIIPAIRGRQRSRTIESIIAEARQLAEQGAKELNLISQDTTWYGKDLPEPADLPALLRALNQVDGIRWIRPLYNHPVRFTDDLIDTIAQLDHVCNYIDMPLQHITDRMLTAMNRETTRRETVRLIGRMRASIHGLALRTTFIVGFPGETDEDFEELYDFVAETRFDRLGVFPYSPEEGTPAVRYPDQVPDDVTQERRARLMELQREISLARNQAYVGRSVEVLVDEVNPTDGTAVGRTEADAPEVDNEVLLTGAGLTPGDFVRATIIDALEYDLVGRVEKRLNQVQVEVKVEK
ncbi:MAG: 30S ribosomal protein S12 methylthiotransferase RimO [Candidatus Latescibacteria bacterium]|nr:30S ribosomal protein S12 methylthiotransferase RimO [Candidatus Latescibacterota bacterium]